MPLESESMMRRDVFSLLEGTVRGGKIKDMRTMIAVFVLGLTILVSAEDVKQVKPAAKFSPSEVQKLKLEKQQANAKLAQELWKHKVDLLPEKAQYEHELQMLGEICATVIKENKWPDSTTCDINTLEFSAPVKPESPKK